MLASPESARDLNDDSDSISELAQTSNSKAKILIIDDENMNILVLS